MNWIEFLLIFLNFYTKFGQRVAFLSNYKLVSYAQPNQSFTWAISRATRGLTKFCAENTILCSEHRFED
jgi:hypothetical protein